MDKIITIAIVLFTLVGCGSEEPSYEEDPAIVELERQYMDCVADPDFVAYDYYHVKGTEYVYLDGMGYYVDRSTISHQDHKGVWWFRLGRKAHAEATCIFHPFR